MGSSSSKKIAEKCSFLTPDEQIVVLNSFKCASKNSDKLKEEDLVKFWGGHIDGRLTQYITNFLFDKKDHHNATVGFEKFAEMYVFCTRGLVEERLSVILQCLGCHDNEPVNVTYILIKEFVESLVSTYMKIQKTGNGKQYKSWTSRGSFTSAQNVQRFAESLTSALVNLNQSLNHTVLCEWLQTCSTFTILLRQVFVSLYGMTHREKEKHGSGSTSHPGEETALSDKELSLIPLCRGLDLIPSYPSLLDMNQLVFLNSHLPADYQTEWRFLFSSQIHGESFSTLIGRIINQGPSILIMEDTNGYMFGGFGTESWELRPKWVGNSDCFLFTLTPKMRIFPATGFNDHFQYLNLHQQTLPNGLGMGGQFDYFGLWLSAEYGSGHTSETCTTYKNYVQMSHQKVFNYNHLEVWGVGPPPPPPDLDDDDDIHRPSILDEIEGRNILEMAGKKIHSDGYREEN